MEHIVYVLQAAYILVYSTLYEPPSIAECLILACMYFLLMPSNVPENHEIKHLSKYNSF